MPKTALRRDQTPDPRSRLAFYWCCHTAVAFILLLGITSAHATVTAYANTGYTYTAVGTRLSADGEVLSPFFDVTAGDVPLYVYNAQVRSVNFPDFPSKIHGTTYSALAINTGNHLENLGTASFVQFQLDGCYNTVLVNPGPGYPSSGMLTPSTNSTQVKGHQPRLREPFNTAPRCRTLS